MSNIPTSWQVVLAEEFHMAEGCIWTTDYSPSLKPDECTRAGQLCAPLVDVVEHADEGAVDPGPVVVEDLLLPLAEVRGADPDRVVDAAVEEES